MRAIFSLIVILFPVYFSYAQSNLVINGDFEEFKSCPQDFVKNGESFTCTHWTSPNNGTPDYFNKCSKLVGVPINFAGVRNAFSGKGYCGIVSFVKDRNYKEYLQGELSNPLHRDKKYLVTIHVCWANESSFIISDLGVKFSDSIIKTTNSSLYKPDLSFKLGNKRNWEVLTDTFIANGNEKFILIGNFQSPEDINFVQNKIISASTKNPIVNSAYYFIDKVELTEITDVSPESFPIGEYFKAEGIYFDTDKYELLDSSSVYLDRLVLFLERNPDKAIKIEGHTDFYGKKEYNYVLSERRALAVKKYLVSKGISPHRISIKGRGDEKLISTDPALQNLNRRIEIQLQ